MAEGDNFALVRKPPSALEKAQPGAKRILSGMVGDTLGLAKKTTSKDVSVADAQSENWFQIGEKYYWGRGVPEDYAEACKWFRKAAEQNHIEAQFILGWCYRHEQGVPLDFDEAAKWFRKAAEQNHAEATDMLQHCYDDDEAAVKWYRKAAEQNNTEAQSCLGAWYYYGLRVPRDYTEAVKWYRKAAEQNNAPAQSCLGVCYERGQGVQSDIVEAYKFYKLAVEQNQGCADAVGYLKRIVTQMTAAEIAEGERRVREFRSSNHLD
jgi:TPR repeat protein